jgi:tetratricopeptide (TPR) repeat protein
MEPFHDIYRKENPPILTSRRWRRRRSGDTASGEGTDPGAQANAAAPGPAPGGTQNALPPRPNGTPLGGPQPHHSHRRHRHRSGQGNPGSRLLWALLVLVFGVYAIVLASSVLRSQQKPRASTGPDTPAPTTSVHTNQQSAADAARRIAERIAAWNKLPDIALDAQSLKEQGFAAQAGERLTRALESTPDALVLKISLAQILIQQEKYPQAVELLIQVLEADPSDQKARLLLASVFNTQTNYPAALSVAKWILETDPNSTEAHQVAANAYLNTDRRSMALPHLRKVVLLDEDNLVAQNKLGVAYTQMGQYAKAIQVFNNVLEHNTTDSMTHYNLAVCYAKQNMADQAVETLTRAIALFGKSFVVTWMKSSDFDTIRAHPLFAALVAQQGMKSDTPATAGITNTGAASPAPAK